MQNMSERPLISRPEVVQLYNFKTINASEISNYPDGMNDLYCRRIDGFLIKNVLSHEEAGTIISHLQDADKKYVKENPVGFSVPSPFATARDEQSANSYFEGAAYFFRESKNVFKIDIIGKVEEVFNKMSGGREIVVPEGNKPGTRFAPANLRVLTPHFGGIHLHSGNYFQKEFPNFFDFLSDKVNFLDQLSYFIMLNPPETGGELTIYDLEWKDAQTKAGLYENNVVSKLDGTQLRMDSVKRMYLSPEKGDMIMFAGGPIWHRVEDIGGTQNRITAGGFMAFSHDDKKIYYWA